jgi:hypothetical protein
MKDYRKDSLFIPLGSGATAEHDASRKSSVIHLGVPVINVRNRGSLESIITDFGDDDTYTNKDRRRNSPSPNQEPSHGNVVMNPEGKKFVLNINNGRKSPPKENQNTHNKAMGVNADTQALSSEPSQKPSEVNMQKNIGPNLQLSGLAPKDASLMGNRTSVSSNNIKINKGIKNNRRKLLEPVKPSSSKIESIDSRAPLQLLVGKGPPALYQASPLYIAGLSDSPFEPNLAQENIQKFIPEINTEKIKTQSPKRINQVQFSPYRQK